MWYKTVTRKDSQAIHTIVLPGADIVSNRMRRSLRLTQTENL
jgi:hypothetical protein